MAIELEACRSTRETDLALLVEIPDIDTEPIWIPKSVITEDSEIWKPGQEGTLVVKEWFAKKQGWI